VVQELVRSFPCQVEALPVLRLTVEQWLVTNAIDVDTRAAAILAAHEAAANAIEHGQCGEIELEARLEPEHMIYLEVRADGTWKPPSTENDERGRGLQLIHGLMESVAIDTHPERTIIRMRRRYRPITDKI
jgi:anti-sigma regulatory factor (Ser/Thr protein kinase)